MNVRRISAAAAATPRRFAALAAATLGAFSLILPVTLLRVQAAGQQEPIEMVVDPIVPGRDALCQVTFSDDAQAKAAAGEQIPVTIYSEPAGAVSYQGVVTGETAVIAAPTNPNISASQITVFVRTDGDQVIGTEVPVVAP